MKKAHSFIAGVTSAALLLSAKAYAAADSHGADHAKEGGAGLPQFDPSSFPSQVFWLAITFGFLYIFFAKKTLPELSSIIEKRHEKIQNDLQSAEKLKSEAEDVQKAYEESLDKARADSSKHFSEAETAIKAKAASQYEAFQDKAATQIAETEKAVEKAKAKAIKDMDALAAEIAREAAEKIIGIETDLDQAKSAVKSLNTSKAKAA